MKRIREILLNEYIGAIAIGFLLAQAAGVAITLIMRPIGFYLDRESRRSIFGTQSFPWGTMVGPAINLVLYAAIAFGLLYWLYLKQAPQNLPSKEAEERSE